MSLRTKWTEAAIRPFLESGVNHGEALTEFQNISDAEKFRGACYKVRNRIKIGFGFSFILDRGPTGNPAILMRRTPTFELKRIQEPESEHCERSEQATAMKSNIAPHLS